MAVCPWWLGYALANPLRRRLNDPASILAPYVREGMTVLESGPGMGFFTLELARRVGNSGRVVAVDIQREMLAGLRRRAVRAGMLDRIELRLAPPESLGIADLAGSVDFCLAFAMVHEMPSAARFFDEVAHAMKPGASLLFAEPAGPVKVCGLGGDRFAAELQAAAQAGLEPVDHPSIHWNHAAVLQKAQHG